MATRSEMVNADSRKMDRPGDGTQLVDMVQSKVLLFAKKVASTILGVHLILYFILHRYSTRVRRYFIFADCPHWPFRTRIDFKRPETCNLTGVRNFYLKTEDDVEIGVWQILPKSSLQLRSDSPEAFEECLGNGKPIVVYVHGNSGDRGSEHRVQLYRSLQEHDCHVIAFDYRNYGDSSPVPPDEVGVVEDAITVIRWTIERKKSSAVFVWGHSLGTGVSSRAVKVLEERNTFVDGLILESPFNNFGDAFSNHPLGILLKHMIGFDYLLIQPLRDDGITFRSDEYLSQCRVPILILHSDNDWIIPARLARRLYEYVKRHRDSSKIIKHVELGSSYGHTWICRCPSLLDLIRLFMEQKYDEIPLHVD